MNTISSPEIMAVKFEPILLSNADMDIIDPTSGEEGETILHAQFLGMVALNHNHVSQASQEVEITEKHYAKTRSKLNILPDGLIGPVTEEQYLSNTSIFESEILRAELAREKSRRILAERERDTQHESSMYDKLTGSQTREGFELSLYNALGAAAETDESANDNMLVLMATDADRFKRVNDTHGHQGGDAILRHFASVFEKSARRLTRKEDNKDTVARIGGDEFFIVMNQVNESKVGEIVNVLRARVNSGTVMYKNSETGKISNIEAGMSVGAIAIGFSDIKKQCVTESGEIVIPKDFIKILKEKADQSLYAEKTRRNPPSFFDKMLKKLKLQKMR